MTPSAKRSSVSPEPFSFRLYVAGTEPTSVRAVQVLKGLCERHLAGAYRLEMVDVIGESERALADGILVTPTLVKLSPDPVRTIIGDLTDETRVLAALGLPQNA